MAERRARARIIQVGLGGWGADWAATVLPTVETVEAVAFVDESPEALERAGKILGIDRSRLFPSLAAARSAVEADAVLGVLPMAGHAALAEATLEAGLHLLIEKPFTASLAEARALIETARARGRILMVSQNYRYHAPVVAAAELLRSGRYGRPISASIEFRQDWKATGHRYHDIPGPLLLDMGIHHFDMLRMILGADVRRVACRSWNTPSSPFRDHAAAHALLELETGLVASYSGSWLRRGVATTWTGDWTIECEAGELSFCARPGAVVPPEAGRLFLRRLDGRVEEVPIAPLPAIDRAGALDAFARTVLGDRSLAHLPLAADNIASLATAFACMRSGAEDGRWITVEERAAVS